MRVSEGEGERRSSGNGSRAHEHKLRVCVQVSACFCRCLVRAWSLLYANCKWFPECIVNTRCISIREVPIWRLSPCRLRASIELSMNSQNSKWEGFLPPDSWK